MVLITLGFIQKSLISLTDVITAAYGFLFASSLTNALYNYNYDDYTITNTFNSRSPTMAPSQAPSQAPTGTPFGELSFYDSITKIYLIIWAAAEALNFFST